MSSNEDDHLQLGEPLGGAEGDVDPEGPVQTHRGVARQGRAVAQRTLHAAVLQAEGKSSLRNCRYVLLLAAVVIPTAGSGENMLAARGGGAEEVDIPRYDRQFHAILPPPSGNPRHPC